MRVLIVEDTPDHIMALDREIVSKFGRGEIDIAKSKDSALVAVKEKDFDLIVLDRKLPTADGAMDDDVVHGDALRAEVRSLQPGTPIRFWTAFPDQSHTRAAFGESELDSVWGGAQIPTISVIQKERPDVFLKELEMVQQEINAVAKIEVMCRPGDEFEYDGREKRAIQIGVRRCGGTKASIRLLTGGYSGSKVIRVTSMNGAHVGHQLIAKLKRVHAVQDLRSAVEKQRLVAQLGAGAAPSIVCQVRYGAGDVGATFYQLADGYNESLFHRLASHPEEGERLVGAVKSLFSPWRAQQTSRKSLIGDLRRRLAPESVFATLCETIAERELKEFEEKEVEWQGGSCHGDLHGENVLVNSECRPILIDCDDAGDGPLGLEPITLELSTLFHKGRPKGEAAWPTLDEAANWHDLRVYLGRCPYPEFVRSCRQWAFDDGNGLRALYVLAYAYAVRQLKYRDTNHKLAIAVAKSAMDAFNHS